MKTANPTTLSNGRKLSFWNLLWIRYTTKGYSSFYEMYNRLSLEPEERKGIVRTIIRAFVRTTILFCILGVPIWLWYYITGSKASLNAIMVCTPCVIAFLSVMAVLSRAMLKDFAAYSKRINSMGTIGASEGIMYDVFDLDTDPD